MQSPLVLTDIFRGILFGLGVFTAIAVLARFLTRREPLRRLSNPLYLLAFTAGAAVFLQVNPTLARPAFVPYFHAAVLFSLAYLAIKLGDLLLVDFFIARRRKFLPPSILRGLISVILYCVALLIIMATVLHINLMPLLATSAVLSLVAGLALQETLSNFFAGVTLATERPFTPGEWVRVGQHVGQVMEMGWRAVKIEIFEENDYLIVPNSVLAKEQVINYSRPEPINGQEVRIGAHYRHPPNKVITALLEAAQGVEGVEAKPAPTARVLKYGDSSIEYRLRYWIFDFEQSSKIEGRILASIWYAFKRHGIEIPFPIRTVHMHAVTEETERAVRAREVVERLALLREVDFLKPLTPDALTQVANSLRPLLYEAGRTVVRQGDEGDSLFLISRGRVGVWVGETDNEAQPVATLGRGQCFGEMSLLTGARRTATVRTVEDTDLLVLGKAEFRDILLADPKVVESLSQILSLRQKEQEAAVARERSTVRHRPESDPAGQFVGLIKSFFGI
jgi:small-conductance mechanosensitive channel/CRP-like cAMP-binding protein